MTTPWLTISERDRRVLAAGVATMMAIVIIGRGLPALRDWQAAREAEASALTLRVQRARAAVRDADRNRRLVADARVRLARYESAILSGPTATSATAQLSELLGEAAASAATDLGAIQLSADSTARTTLSRVTARTEIAGDAESIALFLDALEESPRLLAVRELTITAGAPSNMPMQREQLHATVTVDALFPTPHRQEGRR